MKISSKTRYALRTVLDLAVQKETGVVRVTDIARRQNIPHKFLEQILLLLKGGGIVGSRRGAKGGYFLLKAPEEISLGDVVSLTEESLMTVPRVDDGSQGDAFSDVWEAINAHVVSTLNSVSVAEMCERDDNLRRQRALEYSI